MKFYPMSSHVAGGKLSHPSTIRVIGLGFTAYKAGRKYDVTVDGKPVDLLRLSSESVRFRLGQRPSKATEAKIVISTGGVAVFEAERPLSFKKLNLSADVAIFDVAPSAVVEQMPSRVTVSGLNLGKTTRVYDATFKRECTDLAVTATSVSCMLPLYAAGEFPGGPVEYQLFEADTPTAAFSLQQTVMPPGAQALSLSPATVGSGTSVLITLSHVVPALSQFSLEPVVLHAADNSVAAGVSISSYYTERDAMLRFTLTCFTCKAGNYRIALGERVAGSLGLVHPLLQGSDFAFLENTCAFLAGPVSPASATQEALRDHADPVVFSLPVSGAPLVGEPFITTEDGAGAMARVKLTSSVRAQRAVLTFSPAADFEPAHLGAVSLVFMLTSGGKPTLRCRVPDAFAVSASPVPATPSYINAAVPNVMFQAAADSGNSVTLTLTGALAHVSYVRIKVADKTFACGLAVFDVPGKVLACSFPNSLVPAGSAVIEASATADSEALATYPLTILAATAAKSFSPATAVAYAPTSVTVTLAAAIKAPVLLELALFDTASGARIAAPPAEWVSDVAAVFRGVEFTDELTVGAAFVVPGAPAGAHAYVAGVQIAVAKADAPAPAVEFVVPSTLYRPAKDAVTVTATLRARVTGLSQIASLIHSVAVGAAKAASFHVAGTSVTLTVTLPIARAAHALAFLDKSGREILRRAAAVKVDDEDIAPYYIAGYNTAAFVELPKRPTVFLSFASYTAVKPIVKTSSGGVVADVKVSYSADFDVSTLAITAKDQCNEACLGQHAAYTVTFDIAGRAAPLVFELSYEYVERPKLLSLQPNVFDFSAAQPLAPHAAANAADVDAGPEVCLPYVAALTRIPASVPLALSILLPGLAHGPVTTDPAAGTVSGCLVCRECRRGAAQATPSAPNAGLLSTKEVLEYASVTVVPPRWVPAEDGSDDDDDDEDDKDDQGGPGGLSTGASVAIAFGAVVIVAIMGVIAYRKMKTPRPRLQTKVLEDGISLNDSSL